MTIAQAVVEALVTRGWHIACAESLTGGLLTSTLVDVPGASRAVRGGIVAYDTDVKRVVLGVNADLLARRGAVDPDVARDMATGVRAAVTTSAGPAEVGVATTGVAGPDPQDGKAVGTVYVAVATPDGTRVRELALTGSRAEIRQATVTEALHLVYQEITLRPSQRE